MNVTAINFTRMVGNIRELELALSERTGDRNCFYLAHDDEAYPLLTILVSGPFASILYNPVEFDAGWISQSNPPVVDPGGFTRFSISTFTADDIDIPNDSVVPHSLAMQAANEFFESNSLPRAVEWLKL